MYLAKYAYFGAPNMVKWSVPEKILQNVVQMRCSWVNRALQSKVMTKSNQFFGQFPHGNYNVKLKSGGNSRFMSL